jgi:OOP family OmpA-OmpF porin
MTKGKNVALALISVAALGLPSISMAQSTMSTLTSMGPERGFYVGGSVGQSKIDCDTGGVPGASCDDSDTAYRIFGGYQFNKHLAVELGYNQFGEARASVGAISVTGEAKGWDLVAVGTLPISQQFAVFGKLGMHMTDFDVSTNVPGVGNSSESNSDLTYGVGLQYNFNKNLGLRAEWQQFKKVGDDTDVDVISIGVVYHFR